MLSVPLQLWSSLITVCFVVSQITGRQSAKPVVKTLRCHIRETKWVCVTVEWPAGHQLSDDLSVFNYRFVGCTALLLCSTVITKLPTTFANPPHLPAVKPCEHDVSLPVRQKIKKAPGPDNMSPYCLEVCSDQLAPPSSHRSPRNPPP